MKKKVLLTSILSIVMCMSLIAGATFALFTSGSDVNIAVTSGNLDVKATVESLTTYTDGTAITVNATEGSFALGGTAKAEGGSVVLDRIAPMDKVVMKIRIDSNANIAYKQRVKLSCTDAESGFFDQLLVGLSDNGKDYTYYGNYVTAWEDGTATAGETVTTYKYLSVELPEYVGSSWMNKSCNIALSVEAVQGNAATEETAEASVVRIVNDQDALNAAIAAMQDGETVVLSGGEWETAAIAFDDAKTIVVRGFKVGTMTITAPNGSVAVHCDVGSLNVESVAENSLHVHSAVETMTLKQGRAVLEAGAKVAVVSVEPVAAKTAKVEITEQVEVQKVVLKLENTDSKVEIENAGTVAEVKSEGTVEVNQDNVTINNSDTGEIGESTVEVNKKVENAEELEKAIASGEKRILLAKDITAEKVVVNGELLLDLGGFTLTVSPTTAKTAAITNYGTLTITNGTIVRDAQVTYYVLLNEGVMTLDTLTVRNNNANDTSSIVANNVDCKADNPANLTIESGDYFSETMNAVKNDEYGVLTINGGTFESRKYDAAAVQNWAVATVTGGKFIGTVHAFSVMAYNGQQNTTVISGGTFKAPYAVFFNNGFDKKYQTGNIDCTIEGGSFEGNLSEDPVCPLLDSDSVTITVPGLEFVAYSAKLYVAAQTSLAGNLTLYASDFATLNTALRNSRKVAATVVLATDIVCLKEIYAYQPEALTLDLNGHTLSLQYAESFDGETVERDNCATITVSGNLVIEDSSEAKTGRVENTDRTGGVGIDIHPDNYAVRVGKRGNLVINGGTYYTSADANGNANSVIYIYTDKITAKYAAHVTINGGAFETEIASNGTYFVLNMDDVYHFDCTMTVNGGTFKNYIPGTTNTGEVATLGENCIVVQNGEWYEVKPNDLTAKEDGTFTDSEGKIYTQKNGGGYYIPLTAYEGVSGLYLDAAGNAYVSTAEAMYAVNFSSFNLEEGYQNVSLTLLADITIAPNQNEKHNGYLFVSDGVFDLNGKTLTVSTNNEFMFVGKNITVTNGTIKAGSADIAYPVAATSNSQNVVFEDMEVIGGIQVLGNSTVTLRNVRSTATYYYNVYVAGDISTVTVESGVFTDNGKAHFFIQDVNCVANVNGGTFSGEAGPTHTGAGTLNDNRSENL